MKVLRNPKVNGNMLATIAIGDTYLSAWTDNAYPGWHDYCDRYDLGLVVFDEDMIPQNHKTWKKATWQKILIPEMLIKEKIRVSNVCYLDSDILISPIAQNVFENYDHGTIGLVSQIKNLPFPLELVRRRIAFLRHHSYDDRYPLDSSLFMSTKQIFDYHKLPDQKNFACMGLIIFNVENHKNLMKRWFDKYDRQIHSLSGGGDEPHLNYEIQSWGKVTWLPYEFQSIWIYEMAWKYPFLYSKYRYNNDVIRCCIEASLYSSYFLHFAGSWHESDMWKIGNFFQTPDKLIEAKKYINYLEIPVTGNPKGLVKPNMH